MSAERFRVALLAAIGSLSGVACGGDTRQRTPDGMAPAPAGGADDAGAPQSGGAGGLGGGLVTGGTAGATGGSAQTTTAPPLPDDPRWTTCTNPMPYSFPNDGYERCSSGVVHRATVRDCQSTINPTAVLTPTPIGGECNTAADCTAHPYGYCQAAPMLLFMPQCQYGCVRDSDCGPGEILLLPRPCR